MGWFGGCKDGRGWSSGLKVTQDAREAGSRRLRLLCLVLNISDNPSDNSLNR